MEIKVLHDKAQSAQIVLRRKSKGKSTGKSKGNHRENQSENQKENHWGNQMNMEARNMVAKCSK